MEHTSKDLQITRERANKIHKELENHTYQLLKCFRVGESNNHSRRLRESYRGGRGIAPMNITVKDHKGVDPKSGLPKTRAIVSGNGSNKGSLINHVMCGGGSGGSAEKSL